MLWCNKFIDASIISAYTTFQPVATTIVAIIFLHEVTKENRDEMQKLVIGDLGAFLIIAGLGCVVYDSFRKKEDDVEVNKPILQQTVE